MALTAVLIVKNEEKNIERALKSVGFADEIIVIDEFSDDGTGEIVNKVQKVHKDLRVFQRKLNGDFAGLRNFGLEKASNDWVLFIDADETVSDELKSEIKLKINQPVEGIKLNAREAAFYLRRRDYFWGKEMKYGETKKAREKGLLRLLSKGSGEWTGKVHEVFKLKKQNLTSKTLENYLNHFPHQTVKEFISHVNFYSTLRARELQKLGKKTNIMEIIVFPLVKFLYNYFFKLGFLDGAEGFVYAFFMSFHSFLVRTKLFQYTKISGPV